jgi:hypothetical protein
MSHYNTFQNHPLIPSQQEYVVEKKYVSIHSEDRNILKYPSASDFEIMLPSDYENVSTIKLSTWCFPSNYDTFSIINQNILMTFSFVEVYNPAEHVASPDVLQYLIYGFLASHENKFGTNDFIVLIEEGFYNPTQMAAELTNRFNQTVTNFLIAELSNYDSINSTTFLSEFLNIVAGVPLGGYKEFVIVYNQVQQKIWFGNRSSTFSLTQNQAIKLKDLADELCITKGQLPDDSNIGLPTYVGLDLCALNSTPTKDPYIARFYYGDVLTTGDDGYWLTPNPLLIGSEISFTPAPFKLNNLGPSHFYLEIAGFNSMDETSPFNVSNFTISTNETNGKVNSAFAKIGVVSTPLSQFYDTTIDSFKYFFPPAERIRKLKIRIRYHNGQLAFFDKFPYTFTLEFTMLTPQMNRVFNAVRSYV